VPSASLSLTRIVQPWSSTAVVPVASQKPVPSTRNAAAITRGRYEYGVEVVPLPVDDIDDDERC
jgi:hypothetical protein